MTRHFGLIFIGDGKGPPGRGVFRLYVKNWEHCDYPGIPQRHVYLMPQVTSLGELEHQLDELLADLAVLRVTAQEEHGPNDPA
jgi:hypothetical protein